MPEGMISQIKKVGSRFAFEYFLEVWKNNFITEIKKWLTDYTPDNIKKMIRENKYPDTSELDFSGAKDYYDYIEKITVLRLVEEYLVPARPDLIEAIQEMDSAGVAWLVELRQRLLDQIRVSPKQVENIKQDIVQAICENCGKAWPVPRSEFEQIEECPFCHHKQGEEVIKENKIKPDTETEEE